MTLSFESAGMMPSLFALTVTDTFASSYCNVLDSSMEAAVPDISDLPSVSSSLVSPSVEAPPFIVPSSGFGSLR